MFTDLVGYSALAQRDEPLALKHVDEQRTLARPAYEKFGGRQVKTMGDGALVEFESALDATECAVEIQRRLFERNRAVAGDRIELRIGIHVGDVVHSENDVYGDAVNIASRIEPLSEAGGVCLTGPVFEQVRNKLPYPLRPLERASLKNIETPVSVYRIELPWTPPTFPGETPFTGRAAELDRLQKARAQLDAGEGAAIAVTGEAGVGKSRLLSEFAARVERDGARILRGRGDREGISTPFAAWSEAVRDFARDAPAPLLYKVCDGCAFELVQLVPELRPRLGASAEGPPSGEPSALRLYEGVLRFLDNLGREAPLVVLLDDLQWADPSSLQLLEYVARRLSERRLLLLLAYRDVPPSEAERVETVASELARGHRLDRIPLKRFDAASSHQMLLQMLSGRLSASGGELAPRLFEKTGGNPMILEAIVRSLVEEGSLVWTDAGWTPKAGVDLRLPPGVQTIVRRRLGHLDRSTVDVLRQASVLGSQFTFDALARVTERPPDELLLRLEEALRGRILEERAIVAGQPTYAFADRSVQETLYEEISLVRRSRYHASAARVLESLAAEGASVPAAELAQHFLRANDYDKALEYTLRAGDEAVRLYGREEALRQYALAEELLESRPNEKRRAEVLFKLGDQLDVLGRHTEAYRSLREAAETFERLGFPVEAGEVHRSIARRIAAHNELARALEHLDRARHLLEAGPPRVELARLYDTTGMIMFDAVRMPEATESWQRAIAIASQVGDRKIEASARMMLAAVVPPGESPKVWEYLDSALSLARDAGARTVVPNVLMLKAIALLQIRGDGRAALRAAEDAIEYARQGHDVHHEKMVQGGIVTYVEWRLGDLERAERIALEHRGFAGGDPRRERPTAIAVLAEVSLARGEVDRAEKLLWEGERLLADGGDWTERAQTEIVLARCALARRKALAAAEHLRRSYELCRKAGPPAMDALFLLETLGLLVRAYLDANDLVQADAFLGELRDLAARFGEDLGHAFRARAEGWVRSHRGEIPGGVASLEESAALWKKLGWQYEWAQTVLSLAGLHRSSGDPDWATALTDQATEFLSKVGAHAGPTGAATPREAPAP
jgi:tetratricopeptide (TPR) repeat protein